MGEKEIEWATNLALRSSDGANSHCFDGRLLSHDNACVGFVMKDAIADRRIRACVNAMTGIPDPAATMKEVVEVLEFYANQEVYAPHPNGVAFERRDLSGPARALLAKLEGKQHAG